MDQDLIAFLTSFGLSRQKKAPHAQSARVGLGTESLWPICQSKSECGQFSDGHKAQVICEFGINCIRLHLRHLISTPRAVILAIKLPQRQRQSIASEILLGSPTTDCFADSSSLKDKRCWLIGLVSYREQVSGSETRKFRQLNMRSGFNLLRRKKSHKGSGKVVNQL
jgi:hypothetical protein